MRRPAAGGPGAHRDRDRSELELQSSDAPRRPRTAERRRHGFSYFVAAGGSNPPGPALRTQEAPDRIHAAIMQTIELIDNRQASDRLHVLRFKKPQNFTFQAGQFARLGLEDGDGREPVFRAYSIASAPDAETLDFFITNVQDGKLSPRMTSLKAGDKVLLDGEGQGNLLPRRIPGGETLWLLATGSGLSPFASILNDPKTWESWQDVVLVLSVRKAEDAVLARELSQKRFHGHAARVFVTATREENPDAPVELRGRIPALIASGELERVVGAALTPEKARVLLCGSPDFIADARAELKKRGIVSPRLGKPGQLVAENFW